MSSTDNFTSDDEMRRPLCRFFLMGKCTYGEQCTYRHDTKPEGGFETARKNFPCPYYRNGGCRHKSRCYFSHDVSTSSPDVHGKNSYKIEAVRNNKKNGVSSDNVPTVSLSEEKISSPAKDTQCGICYDDIISSGKRFALLSNCSHIFCYSCIKEWHEHAKKSLIAQQNGKPLNRLVKHSCPTCRTESEFVLPNKMYYSGELKARKIEEFKSQRLTKPCRNFNGRIGSCPFGRDCFYAHESENGIDMKHQDLKREEIQDDCSNSSVEHDYNEPSFVGNAEEELATLESLITSVMAQSSSHVTLLSTDIDYWADGLSSNQEAQDTIQINPNFFDVHDFSAESLFSGLLSEHSTGPGLFNLGQEYEDIDNTPASANDMFNRSSQL